MRKIKLLLFAFLTSIAFSSINAQVYLDRDDLAALTYLESQSFLSLGTSALASNSIGVSIGAALGSEGIFLIPDPTYPDSVRVRRLELSGKRATGSLLPLGNLREIFVGDRLSNLSHLDLSNNMLNGDLPPPFAYLEDNLNNSLVYLNLSDNRIQANPNNTPPTNALAEAITNFRQLDTLLANGAFRFTFPFPTFSVVWDSILTNCPRLSVLDLSNNNMHDLNNGLRSISMNTPISNSVTTSLKTFIFRNNGLQVLGPLDSVSGLGVALFDIFPNIEHIDLSNNNLVAYPRPSNGSYYDGLVNLKKIDLSVNTDPAPIRSQIELPMPLVWFIGKQLRFMAGNGATNVNRLRYIDFSRSQWKEMIINEYVSLPYSQIGDGNLDLLPTFFPNLDTLRVDNNKLKFKDLVAMARMLKLQTNGFGHYDLIANNSSFVYAPQQTTLGIGGVRRTPENRRITLGLNKDLDNVDEIEPSNGYGANGALASFLNANQNTYIFRWRKDTTLNVVDGINHVTLFSIKSPAIIRGSVNTLSNSIDTAISSSFNGILSNSPVRNAFNSAKISGINGQMQIRLTMDSTNLNQTFIYGIVKNDKFPGLELPILEKKIMSQGCYDARGREIHCQEVAVEKEDSVSQASMESHMKNDYGPEAELIDDCVCGKLQVWAWSDTFRQIQMETNGRTTVSQPSTQSRPGLKSADHNYPFTSIQSTSDPNPNYTEALRVADPANTRALLAIIDSGTDPDHPQMARQIKSNSNEIAFNNTDDDGNCEIDDLLGFNYFNRNGKMYDDHGHGTAVAGIAVGKSTPSLSPQNDSAMFILPIKYTNQYDEGTSFQASCAIYYAAVYNKDESTGTINANSSPVRVINASWGYNGLSCTVLKNAIQYAQDSANILFVCAAGNDAANLDTFPHYPSNYPVANILAVTAVDANFQLSAYANRSASHADIAAFGTYTQTLQPTDTLGNNPYNNTATQGTSFATPMVARAATILAYEFPNANYCDLKAALINSAVALPNADSNFIRAKGYVNLDAARIYMRNIALGQSVCDTSGAISVVLSVDEANPAQKSWYKLYPNPAQNNLNVEIWGETINESLLISIIDAKGLLIASQVFERNANLITIPIQNLAQGLYIIQIKSSKGITTDKFIKMD